MRTTIRRAFAFNSSRVRLEQENRAFAASVSRDALVLDAGAGDQPYRGYFAHARYESADFQAVDKSYAEQTYVCDLASIPVEDERFHAIVFNQVMEHLPEPALVLRELHRVLRPGGSLIYTGPLFYEEHEIPYDFFRYTRFGLAKLFAETGFQVERLEWLEGYFGTVAYQLNRMAVYLPSRPRDIGTGRGASWALAPVLAGIKVASGLLSLVFHRLELASKYTARGYPKNYVAVLSKPA